MTLRTTLTTTMMMMSDCDILTQEKLWIYFSLLFSSGSLSDNLFLLLSVRRRAIYRVEWARWSVNGLALCIEWLIVGRVKQILCSLSRFRSMKTSWGESWNYIFIFYFHRDSLAVEMFFRTNLTLPFTIVFRIFWHIFSPYIFAARPSQSSCRRFFAIAQVQQRTMIE